MINWKIFCPLSAEGHLGLGEVADGETEGVLGPTEGEWQRQIVVYGVRHVTREVTQERIF